MVKSSIEGVTITELGQFCDERGAVLHMLRNDSSDFTQFGECYISEILPEVVKAWKKHRYQTQNFAVPCGRIRLVIYDNRYESNTQGVIQEIELGRPDNYFRIKIPPGLWYGFSCISNVPALIVNCADLTHDPSECESKVFDDSEIPYNW